MLEQSNTKIDVLAVAPLLFGYEDRLFDALTLAFAADPAVRWLFPDPGQYLRYFPKFARAFGGAAIECRTATAADDFSGAALWLPPDMHPDDEALLAVIAEGVANEEKGDVFMVFEEMAHHHPTAPHWYLPLIGVEPARRGQGLGSSLLQPILTRCDENRRIAYLEATSPRNRSLYERHGFEAVGEIRVGNCPPITPMVRRPRPH